MRITNSILMRGYNRDYQRLMSSKNEIERKITSTRNFNRASESPLSAAKALNVRKSYYYSEQHKENLKVASKFYTEAETSMLQVSEDLAEIRELLIAACNTTKDTEEWNIYAQQLETKARELCTIFNTDSAGRAIFAGESDNGLPFTIIEDSNGNAATVLYHGVPVSALSDYNCFPYSDGVYIDIGLGMFTNQKSHVTDSQTVLITSFNGAKVTGCGAEWGVADIDLSSIKEGRKYVLDIYAGNVKKTIEFKGQGSYEDNVAEFNRQLREAWKKEIAYGKDYPQMDERGIISLRDSDGNAVDGGIVCATNHETDDPRVDKMGIDNDSGYTNKYVLNANKLPEGSSYSIDVTVNGEKKTIIFESGTDDLTADPPVYREDVTIKNVQDALDAAFGKGVVNISANDPTKGVFTTEGGTVVVTPTFTDSISSDVSEVTITTTKTDSIDFSALEDGTEYSFTVNGIPVRFTASGVEADNRTAILNQLGAGFSIDGDGVISQDGNPVRVEDGGNLPYNTSTAYAVGDMEPGKKYALKVIVGNSVRDIEFTAGEDPLASLQETLNNLFSGNDITVAADGTVTAGSGKAISIADNSELKAIEGNPFEKQAIYSNNYIQLTLDAARALREGDLSYANGCIDRIVTANSNLLVEIADLGCNEEFIDFNIARITTREENLAERQNDLEFIDPEKAITLWKQYEALFNAILQMSSTVVPQSIFNYMN